LFQRIHDIGDEYRMALYNDAANLGPDTTVYTAEGEVGGRGYEAGGIALENVRPIGEGLGFDEPVWRASTIAATGCMIYNASKDNRAVAVFSFGGVVESRNGRFFVKTPSGDKGAVRL